MVLYMMRLLVNLKTMHGYKEGDWVLVKYDGGIRDLQNKVGTYQKVTRVVQGMVRGVECISDPEDYCYHSDWFEPAFTGKFKVGDTVKIKSKTPPRHAGRRGVGETTTIKRIEWEEEVFPVYVSDEGNFYTEHDLELVQSIDYKVGMDMACSGGGGGNSYGANITCATQEYVDNIAYGIDYQGLLKIKQDKKQTIMKKLSNAFKKFLNAEIKAQVQAGFRDSNLELTSLGKEALFEIIAEKYSKELVEMAEAKIAEEKEEEKKA